MLDSQISDLIERLGEGICDSVAYDTAWGARVPAIHDPGTPAFPQCIEWLRRNQLADGSWGTDSPASPHANTLSTLTAIVALAEWKNVDDIAYIDRGIQALQRMTLLLPTEEHFGAGFELILPALLKDAREMGLKIPFQAYSKYNEIGEKKLNMLQGHLLKTGFDKPATWWHSLEMLGDAGELKSDNLSLKFTSRMLTKSGSVALSPASTAYLLRKLRLEGSDMQKAEDYLSKLYKKHHNGLPHMAPLDIFEIAFSLDYFLMAGVSPEKMGSALRKIADLWSSEEGVSFSGEWLMHDADDTALGLYVLNRAGYTVSPKPLLGYFDGKCIAGYKGESTHGLSVNLNAMKALRLYEKDPEVKKVMQTILQWIESQASDSKKVFADDKWNFSPYYNVTRALYSLIGMSETLVQRCMQYILSTQNKDGGWGKDGNSSPEETAWVCLALYEWIKSQREVPRNVLLHAQDYLNEADLKPKAPLWIAKVLYCPILIRESAILAAKYALNSHMPRNDVAG